MLISLTALLCILSACAADPQGRNNSDDTGDTGHLAEAPTSGGHISVCIAAPPGTDDWAGNNWQESYTLGSGTVRSDGPLTDHADELLAEGYFEGPPDCGIFGRVIEVEDSRGELWLLSLWVSDDAASSQAAVATLNPGDAIDFGYQWEGLWSYTAFASLVIHSDTGFLLAGSELATTFDNSLFRDLGVDLSVSLADAYGPKIESFCGTWRQMYVDFAGDTRVEVGYSEKQEVTVDGVSYMAWVLDSWYVEEEDCSDLVYKGATWAVFGE